MTQSSSSANRRIGVFGGTFDPPHFGHLAIAQEAFCRLALERVLFVPAGQPPHKPGRPISPAHDRVAMLERAIAGNPAFEMRLTDVNRAGPSYTADMLALLHRELGPACDLYFIVGMDSLHDFPTWREPARILRLARLAAVSRPGYTADLATLERAIPGASDRVIVLEGPGLDISASELQRRVRVGLPIRYLVPDAVAEYVAEHRLYLDLPDTPAPGGAHPGSSAARLLP